MKTIYEEKTNTGNNESLVKKGIYQNADGSYTWMTYTRSGSCKKLSTAKEKIGLK